MFGAVLRAHFKMFFITKFVLVYINRFPYFYTCARQLHPHLSFQPSTFPLPDLWHAIRTSIIYDMQSRPIFHCRKISQSCFPFSHFFAFLNYVTGPNIPYQAGRKFTEQRTVSFSTLDTETTTPIQPTRTQPLCQPLAKHEG